MKTINNRFKATKNGKLPFGIFTRKKITPIIPSVRKLESPFEKYFNVYPKISGIRTYKKKNGLKPHNPKKL